MFALFSLVTGAWMSTAEMGTLSVTVDAAPYRGRRVQVEGWIRGELDGDWSGLWLRVDGRERRAAFDSTLEQGPRGDGWIVHTAVLEVPADASHIAFGLLMSGNQTVQVDDLVLVDVGRAHPRQSTRGRARVRVPKKRAGRDGRRARVSP
jgi:hypothetical protein